MADISLLISVKTDDVVKSIKVINKLKTDANLVFKSLKKGTDSYTKGLSEVRKSLVATGMTSKQAYGEVKKLEYAYARTKALEKSVKLQKRRAAALKETIAAERKAQVETKKLAAEVDRLSSKYKPLYAASKQYEKSLDEINRAHKVGAINTKQHSAAIENLNSDYQKFTSGNAGWDNQFVQGSNRAGKSMNKFGMYAQQVGYQVGDFFVQVQSGQSALVAFGQQGTQLAGLLPGVTGAVVGIGLAVGTMLLRSFMDASGEAQTLEEAISGAEEALDDFKNAVRGADDLKDDFGSMATEMGKVADEAARFAENILAANVGQAIDMLDIKGSSGLEGVWKNFTTDLLSWSPKDKQGNKSGTTAFTEQSKLDDYGFSEDLTVDKFKGLTASITEAISGGEYKTALEKMTELYNSALSGMSDLEQQDIGTSGKEFIEGLEKQRDLVAKFVKAREDAAAAPDLLDAKKTSAQEAAMLSLTDKIELLNIEILKTQDSDAYDAELSRQRIRDQDLQLLAQVALGKLTKEDASDQREALGLFESKLLIRQSLVRLEKADEAAQKAALKVANEQLRLRQANEKAQAAAIARQLAAAVKLAAKQEEQNKRDAYSIKLQRDKTSLLRLEELGKKKSLEYRELEIQVAQQISLEASRRAGVDAQIAEDLAIQARLQATISNEITDSADRMAALAKSTRETAVAMRALNSVGDGLSKSLVVAQAKLKDLKEGGTGRVAGTIAGLRKDIEDQEFEAFANGKLPDDVILGSIAQQYDDLKKYAAVLREIAAIEDRNKPNKEVKDNAYEKLRVEIDRRRALLSLSKEQATSVRNLWSLQDALGKSSEKYSKDKLKAIVAEEIALKKLEEFAAEAVAKQEALSKSIESSIENGFMKMIDGTTSVKDAFKSMAADIIKELYRVLVVQEMVAAAKLAMDARGGFLKMAASFFMADGGAFSGGSQMKAYADGGVVGGPTTFGMSGGKTGLMGEAGPEAIMPLKRGANGKLGVQVEGGGGGDVININQSFNFQANGDDSVKKLIAQAAPKIADMAKASVIESRRRGGSTKAAFG